jgi:biotin synthase
VTRIVVVTGTDTGVGKTVVTAALAALAAARGERIAVIKPAQTGAGTGEPGDLDEVRRLSGVTDLHELARFTEPLAPATAARRAGAAAPTVQDIARSVEELAPERDLVLIEGAGGVLVHLDAHGGTIADLAARLAAPVIVVTRPGLGTLNATALTCEALRARDVACLGLVIGAWPADPDLAALSNLDDLPAYAGAPLLGRLPDGAGAMMPSAFVNAARRGLVDGLAELDDVFPAKQEVTVSEDILEVAREQVLERGIGLDEAQTLEVLRLPDERVSDALALAHEVRMRWCGPEVEIEGIVSVKTGGCPEDCHFCSQSGRFDTPVRAARLDIPSMVQAAKETAETGATEFCIVAAVRGPDPRLMAQVREGVTAIHEAVDINVACSLGILTEEQGEELRDIGVHRYNHNLETARSHFPDVVTTHTWEERWDTLQLVRRMGMEVCCGGIIGMGETLEQRAEFAAQLAELDPHEVPMNFLDPRPGTPFEDLDTTDTADALRTIAAFRLALPRTVLRFAGGRELTLGEMGTEQGLLGGINAMIVGNYLTTLGRSAQDDLDLLAELRMPVKELSKVL